MQVIFEVRTSFLAFGLFLQEKSGQDFAVMREFKECGQPPKTWQKLRA